ncbi:amino acid permease [Gryllotalpicola koreensis]|uniref:Amino acid permease n=1 Tax=Gryllotalpicola koreensis TaxID=993086 RepID=A0ABP7ZX54_9MICO
MIWIEWASFVVAWPGIMGTITLEAAFAIDPSLRHDIAFLILTVVVVTWLAAFLALRGMRLANALTWFAVGCGVVVPTLLVCAAAIGWLVSGHPIAMSTAPGSLLPRLHGGDAAFLSGALLMFMGIEISAVHAPDIRHPGRTVPRANAIAVGLCLLLTIPLTLALAVVLPGTKIDIVTGVLQASRTAMDALHAGWLVPVLAAMLVLGLAAAMVQILGGPSRGLMVAARDTGLLPPLLQRQNRAGMPVSLILLQAALSSVLALGYHLLGSVQNAWFMFVLIQTNMSLLLYALMFGALIRLRHTQPNAKRPYLIPGGRIGLAAVCAAGGAVCLFGLLLSLFPTSNASGIPLWAYEVALVGGTVVFTALPLALRALRRKSWTVAADAAVLRSVDG